LARVDPHKRAIVAAAVYSIVTGRRVAGVNDQAAGRHLWIAAECLGDRVHIYDGERRAWFGGTLPELCDHDGDAFLSLTRDGATIHARDWTAAGSCTATADDRTVLIFDVDEQVSFAFAIQMA
jgi:hypothetical protein